MASAYQREYPFAAAPVGCFLSAGCMVPGASGAPDGRGARQKLHVDPAAAVAIRVSAWAIGRLVFRHVLAGILANPRLFEIYRTPVVKNLDAGSALRVGAGRYGLFWVGCAGIFGTGSFVAIWAGAADMAAVAGDGDIFDGGVYSGHAGARYAVAHRNGSWPCEFAGCDGYL